MKLLLISNSASPGEAYLEKPLADIKRFAGEGKKKILFIPYAAITFSYDEYEAKLNKALGQIGLEATGIHHAKQPIEAVMQAQLIMVGGGNTFMLTKMMQEQGLISAIRERVRAGVPYIGWSAGSNVCCPTLCTTNDMPITQPESFAALGLVPFQINPHYLDNNPSNHGGETREQRLLEYIEANPSVFVVGLREGSRLWIEDGKIQLLGERPLRLFKHGAQTREMAPTEDLQFLLEA